MISIDATENASPHHTNAKKYRKTGKREDKKNEHDDKETWEALKMKLRDRPSSNTNYDQDSDISFKSETDEEIDTPAIERRRMD